MSQEISRNYRRNVVEFNFSKFLIRFTVRGVFCYGWPVLICCKVYTLFVKLIQPNWVRYFLLGDGTRWRQIFVEKGGWDRSSAGMTGMEIKLDTMAWVCPVEVSSKSQYITVTPCTLCDAYNQVNAYTVTTQVLFFTIFTTCIRRGVQTPRKRARSRKTRTRYPLDNGFVQSSRSPDAIHNTQHCRGVTQPRCGLSAPLLWPLVYIYIGPTDVRRVEFWLEREKLTLCPSPALIVVGWQWRNFVSYLCQLIFCRHLVGKTLRNVCHCDSA